MSRRHAAEVVAALALDAVFGEPPERLHPTVWMGRVISACETRALRYANPDSRRIAGIALATVLPAAAFLAVHCLIGSLPRPLRSPLGTVLISTTLSMRGLAKGAGAVQIALQEGELARARERAGEMVGRDTDGLQASELARAAIESVAENTSDGVAGPLLYGYLLGAPGAIAYRTVNSLDSMIGYRVGPYAELGWASARLDDLANLVPARITVLLAAAASGRPARTLAAARRYGPLTDSPNAGWAEAAFAGALGLRLGGVNSYGGVARKGPTLGDGRPPQPEDIWRAVGLMRRTCGLLAAGLLLWEARRG